MKNFIYLLFILNNCFTYIPYKFQQYFINKYKKKIPVKIDNKFNEKLKSFCKSITLDKYSPSIRITKHNDQLIIYNGDDKIGILYPDGRKEKFSIFIDGDYTLMQIQTNDNFILLSYNINDTQENHLSCYYIINKNTQKVQKFFHTQPLIGSYFLDKNYIILVDIFNTIICYDYNQKVIWQNKFSYSKMINNDYDNIIINNDIYWIFNDDLIYILNKDDGNIKESINIAHRTIINILFYKENLVVITKNAIIIYDLYTLQPIKIIDKLYPISKGVIYDNTLYFHDNKTLYQLNLLNYNLSRKNIKSNKEEFSLLNILVLNEAIIIPSSVGKWYVFHKNKKYVFSKWQFWTKIEPTVYKNKIIFYKNFSRQYFDFMNLEELLKLND